MNKTVKVAALLAIGAVTLSACAYTQSGEVALQYDGGVGASRTFVTCVPANAVETVGPSDDVYYYQVGARDFNFTRDPGADTGPLTTTTKGDGSNPGVELAILGQVKFSVTSDCDKLRAFHERIGLAKKVYSKTSGEVGDGWQSFIENNIKTAVDRVIDNESPNYTSAELYNQPDKRAEWEKAVAAKLPEVLTPLIGDGVVTVDAVTLQKPDLPDAVKNGIVAQEEARVRQQAADTDLRTAEKFGGIQGYTAYLANMAEIRVQEAIARGIDDKRLAPAVVPQGASIMVPK